MKRMVGARGAQVLLTALVILTVGASLAVAAIPSGSGEFVGCYVLKNGVLRVIDFEAGARCNNSEKEVRWSQQGVKGDPGEKGDKGDPGEPGEDGEDGQQGPPGDPAVLGENSVTSFHIAQGTIGGGDIAGGAVSPVQQDANAAQGTGASSALESGVAETAVTTPLAVGGSGGPAHSVLLTGQVVIVCGCNSDDVLASVQLLADGVPVSASYTDWLSPGRRRATLSVSQLTAAAEGATTNYSLRVATSGNEATGFSDPTLIAVDLGR